MKYRISALCPNHSNLRQSLSIKNPALVTLQENPYFVVPLEGNGAHIKKRVERCFYYIQKALSGVDERKQQWE